MKQNSYLYNKNLDELERWIENIIEMNSNYVLRAHKKVCKLIRKGNESDFQKKKRSN